MRAMQNDMIDRGTLRVSVTTVNNIPIDDVKISVYREGEQTDTIEQLRTDNQGKTEAVTLEAPPVEYSLDRSNILQPYAEYTVLAQAEGFAPVNISGIQILSGEQAVQNIRLRPLGGNEEGREYAIPPHTLYGDYPPKIAEEEIKPDNRPGEIVLSRVVVPEYVIVHDGPPSDTSAADYYVPYREYIKNVASSEIYATWKEEAIRANVLAIMSFTLNRVYTEWYRNKGYNFTITSSTAYDHKWMNNRNIFDSIASVVDSIFNQYLSRPNVKQPILTQYCDGNQVTCPGWLSQWGSKELADAGYTALQILRNYYGSSIYINTAEQIAGVPSSYPGYPLDIGATGEKVRQIQEQLDRVAEVYFGIPRIRADGIFGEKTKAAVTAFQRVFNLPQTGVIDFATWYKISQIYVGVTRIAELS